MDKQYEDFFDKLYLENYKKLIKYIFRLVYDRSYAEEIVQETFTEAYRKIDTLTRHENPAGWLYITAKNITRAYLRDIKKIKSLLPLADYDQPVSYEDNCPEFSDFLSKVDADILRRFYEYRQSISEISAHYHISISACKMRLKRARDKFKKKYENFNSM